MFFKIHRGYMCNYPHAVRRLRIVCERSSKFSDFIKTKLQPYVPHTSPHIFVSQFFSALRIVSRRYGMSIEKCLKLPSTRLETYVRTLEATLSATPASNASYSKWQHGLLNIMSLFSRVNNDVALERDMCLMALLQKRFDGAVEIKETARISRRLVHSGSLRKVCRKTHKKFAFFLFSDLLVYEFRRVPVPSQFGRRLTLAQVRPRRSHASSRQPHPTSPRLPARLHHNLRRRGRHIRVPISDPRGDYHRLIHRVCHVGGGAAAVGHRF
jgi:hypothetical protein